MQAATSPECTPSSSALLPNSYTSPGIESLNISLPETRNHPFGLSRVQWTVWDGGVSYSISSACSDGPRVRSRALLTQRHPSIPCSHACKVGKSNHRRCPPREVTDGQLTTISELESNLSTRSQCQSQVHNPVDHRVCPKI